MVQEFGDVFDIMYNRVRMGQLFSLDKAYAAVRPSASVCSMLLGPPYAAVRPYAAVGLPAPHRRSGSVGLPAPHRRSGSVGLPAHPSMARVCVCRSIRIRMVARMLPASASGWWRAAHPLLNAPWSIRAACLRLPEHPDGSGKPGHPSAPPVPPSDPPFPAIPCFCP